MLLYSHRQTGNSFSHIYLSAVCLSVRHYLFQDVKLVNKVISKSEKNSDHDQFQVLADILFAAAKEGGHVDPNKVEKILGIPHRKNACTSVESRTITEETMTG